MTLTDYRQYVQRNPWKRSSFICYGFNGICTIFNGVFRVMEVVERTHNVYLDIFKNLTKKREAEV